MRKLDVHIPTNLVMITICARVILAMLQTALASMQLSVVMMASHVQLTRASQLQVVYIPMLPAMITMLAPLMHAIPARLMALVYTLKSLAKPQAFANWLPVTPKRDVFSRTKVVMITTHAQLIVAMHQQANASIF
jgi:uracil phosphoribosyltransferase